jgi:threonine dehydrogenase-like Zn-dependent dehydrogenase
LKVAAPVNCAVATVAGGLRLAGDLAGKKVCIVGAGMLGMMAIAMAKSMNASSIIAMDIDPQRLGKAKRFGADRTLELSGKPTPAEILHHAGLGDGADMVFELSGGAASMELSLELLKIGGVAIWIGGTYPQRTTAVSGEKVIRKLLTIKGLHNYNAEDFMHAVYFVEQQHQAFPFSELVEREYELDDVNSAFEFAVKQKPIRVGIHF